MASPPTVETTGKLYGEVYVIGDVHGSLDGLRAILGHAGLIDSEDKWTGRRAQVVQCGDVVDRGPDSEGCLELLLKLRREARQAGGCVDLLVGNHELALAQGDYTFSDVSDPAALQRQLAKLIRLGRLQAARAYRQYLITHAGVTPDLMRWLVSQLQQNSGRKVTIAALARYLNQALKSAFLKGDFSNPIFRIGQSRGGPHASGGIFWADFNFEHDTLALHPEIWQVFGHTPPRGDRPFRVSPDERRVNVDVGICGHYGGYRAYVKLLPDRIVGVHCDQSRFEEDVLATVEESALV